LTKDRLGSRLSGIGRAHPGNVGQKAVVAGARELAIVLHRMWRDGADFSQAKAA